MKNLLKINLALFLVLLFSGVFAQNTAQPKIQVALILDTSNSMDGLIEQAKTELWSVVNELATSTKAGQTPILEIALYEYGNDGLQQENGFIRKVLDLTDDLDKISEQLFSLKTNGGYEYCGHVIQKATSELKWSNSPGDLKLIFIAGNEAFTQGTVLYTDACKGAISKGILVNTIFCGNKEEGINTKWKDGADLADGKYLNIDHNQVIAYVESPFDNEIELLSRKLNSTYVAYGAEAEEMSARQEAQDNNAGSVSKSASVNRAVSKSSKVYNNSSWDLVDAVGTGKVKVSDVKDSELPEEMQNMSAPEKEAFIKKKKQERIHIQNKINELNKKRAAYVQKVQSDKAQENTLGNAMIKVVREQAQKQNFSFKN